MRAGSFFDRPRYISRDLFGKIEGPRPSLAGHLLTSPDNKNICMVLNKNKKAENKSLLVIYTIECKILHS